MLQRNLSYLLAVLLTILWTGQPLQAGVRAGESPQKPACGGLWPVEQQKKWGYIDQTGRIAIPGKFDGASVFSEGLAAVVVDDKCGYIDETGKFVVPPRFASGYPFADGMALVTMRLSEQGEYHPLFKFGYIDREGNLIFQSTDIVTSKDLYYLGKEMVFSEGLGRVSINDKFGYIDKSGRQVIPAQYDDAQPFAEGLAAVLIGGKYGYIDRTGKQVIPPRFQSAGQFSEGLALVDLESVGDRGGYIDKSGKLVIKAGEFVLARRFAEGLAAARGKNGKYGFIDKSGKFVIPPRFYRVGSFFEGLAAVELPGAKWPGNLAYINHQGRMVLKSLSTVIDRPDKVEFDLSYYRFCGGVARVSLGKKDDTDAEGYISKEGKVIWPQAK